MTADHLSIAVFVLAGAAFVATTLAVSRLLQPREPSAAKLTPYECGSEPVGPPWVQFRIGYYVYALLFVIFDIEVVFLYPWAVAFGSLGIFVLIEMAVFVGILALGLAYAWREGALEWR
ncbi:MAG: NADH-quinone oxidoreductase subunit A [Coriobacteriia bacterium]|nr:NADH-quinone oxidoreductase subunit A [Coriobacteriia bacterium]